MDRLTLAPSDSLSQAGSRERTPARTGKQRTQQVYQYKRDLNGICGRRSCPALVEVELPCPSLGGTADSFLISFGFDVESRGAIFSARAASSSAEEFVDRLSRHPAFSDQELRWIWDISVIATDDDWDRVSA